METIKHKQTEKTKKQKQTTNKKARELFRNQTTQRTKQKIRSRQVLKNLFLYTNFNLSEVHTVLMIPFSFYLQQRDVKMQKVAMECLYRLVWLVI